MLAPSSELYYISDLLAKHRINLYSTYSIHNSCCINTVLTVHLPPIVLCTEITLAAISRYHHGSFTDSCPALELSATHCRDEAFGAFFYCFCLNVGTLLLTAAAAVRGSLNESII